MNAADATVRAWAYLSRVAEPPRPDLAALVARVGPVEAAERIRRGAVEPKLAEHTEARRHIDSAAEDLELLYRRGGRLITPMTRNGRCSRSPPSTAPRPRRNRTAVHRWRCGR